MSAVTQYPLVLAHGLARPDTGVRRCTWGRIPALLRAEGAAVYLAGQDAWGSIETGAAQLARAVDRARGETGCGKVNIIAHSKGGLEARYLISRMGYAGRVASLTMLATPNRGARAAERLLRLPVIGIWARDNDARWRGRDTKPETLHAGRQLTPAALARFNRETPDAPAVYYQSWGACIDVRHPDRAMALAHALFYRAYGASDGMVTPESARWGAYRGTLAGVSHQQLVDAADGDGAFDIAAFYRSLVCDLAEKGF